MKTRPATIADAEALGRGMKAVADEGPWLATEAGVSVEDMAKRYRRAFAEGHQSIALLGDEGEIVGSIDLHPTPFAGVITLGMWILPEFRGKGGGRALIEAGIATRPEGTHKIELECWPENVAALALYRATGFEEDGLRRKHYRRRDGSLRSAVIMSRLFLD